ncbi:MAG: AzlD domain-containing protein [Leptolyngbyaceae bacterium]|nr:AzlD domain-containing protein [Leptolyngbyaceae bacterium]
MNEFLMITGMAIATFAIRYVMFGASNRITLSPAVLNALRYVPPVVLTAIVVPEVLMSEGSLQVSYLNARLVGAIAAILVAWKTKNLLWTILLGMTTFFLWKSGLAILT